jgi:hypothetical protein
VGKGWYSETPTILDNGQQVIDRTLTQQYQTIHEIQVAYAQSLDYVNGLTPALDRFYIGISPSFLFGGNFMDARYNVKYYSTGDGGFERHQSFYQASSGVFSDVTQHVRNNKSALPTIRQYLSPTSLSESSGYGMGIDFGLTYVYPLSNKVRLSDDQSLSSQPDQQAIRVSLALNDIGFFNHSEIPTELQIPADTVSNPDLNKIETSDELYNGSPGAFIYRIQQQREIDDLYVSATDQSTNSQQYFPGQLQAGIAILLDRFTLAADFQAALGNRILNGADYGFHTGIEFYPVNNWALRSGVNLQRNRSTLFTFGTGYTGEFWSVNSGVQLANPAYGMDWNIHGMAVTTFNLQF